MTPACKFEDIRSQLTVSTRAVFNFSFLVTSELVDVNPDNIHPRGALTYIYARVCFNRY